MKKSKTKRMELANVVNSGKGKGKMGAAAFKNDNYKGNKKHLGFKNQAAADFGPKKSLKTTSVAVKNNGASTSTGLQANPIHLKKCFYCQSTEHLRKHCPGFQAWLIKKGISKPKGDK